MIYRPIYVDKIMAFTDTPFVRILTGVRRCGKSTILKMIIRTVKEGAMWLDPQVVPILRDKNCGVIPPRQMSRAMFKEQHANLTQREYEVLKLVVDGKSNSEIAQELTISEHTAKAHVCNIIQKLVVDDRTQAAVKALKEGLV